MRIPGSDYGETYPNDHLTEDEQQEISDAVDDLFAVGEQKKPRKRSKTEPMPHETPDHPVMPPPEVTQRYDSIAPDTTPKPDPTVKPGYDGGMTLDALIDLLQKALACYGDCEVAVGAIQKGETPRGIFGAHAYINWNDKAEMTGMVLTLE